MPQTVSLEVTTNDLPLRQLVGTIESLDSLLRHVSNAATEEGAVRWTVKSVSMASPYLMVVEPTPGETETPSSLLDKAASAVTDGLALLQSEPSRPPFFTDKALGEAKKLAQRSTNGTSLRVGSSREHLLTLTHQMVEHIDEVIGPTFTSRGTLDGRLEGLNFHGRTRTFNIYDSLHNRRIPCDFASRIDKEEISRAVERRVAVHGEIVESMATGRVVKIKADSIEVFPREDELPTAEDVLGIFDE